LRPAAADADLIADTRLIKSGRTMVYGEVTLHAGQPEKPVAHITSTYMLL
jgi:acyl-coenzyme A thioesterase PaaI-like protein